MNRILEGILPRQAYIESRFNPYAVNKESGATGLTQFMPKTWEDYKKAKKNSNLNIYDPVTAIDAQRWYMGWLNNHPSLHVFNNSEPDKAAAVLAAYNWGVGNFNKMLGRLKKQGVDITKSSNWLGNLPRETRNYIKTVLHKEDSKFEESFQKAMQTSPIAKLFGTPALPGTERFKEVPSQYFPPAEKSTYREGRTQTPLKRKEYIKDEALFATSDPAPQAPSFNYMDFINDSLPKEHAKIAPAVNTAFKVNNIPSSFFGASFFKKGGKVGKWTK